MIDEHQAVAGLNSAFTRSLPVMPPSASDPVDLQLVRRMAAGDSEALGQLYDRHAELLLAIGVRILGERQSAEDLVHDVMMEAWRKAGDYDPSRSSVRGWLVLRCRSRALDRRQALPRARWVPLDEATPQALVSPPPAAGEDTDRVRAALDGLPEPQRQVLELVFWAGLSAPEIAARLDTPVGTVKSRVRLGLTTLRGALGVA